MNEKLIKTLDLKNGLQLKIYDASKKLVGDRWRVSMIARMEIPVTQILEKNDPLPKKDIDEITNVLGECITFEQKREKIFVDFSERESFLKEMQDMLLGSSLDYLSRETFPRLYILKKYKEHIKKAALFGADSNSR